MNHDQKDQDESAPSRTDAPEIQPGGEGIPPSAKGSKSLMSRFRTWYYNRHSLNHDQKDQDESAPSRTDTPEIQPGGEGIPPSAKGPKSLMSRFRTWYYNRHTFALEPDEPQEQPKRNARFFKRVGGRPVLGPVKLKLVRAKRGVKDFFLDHPRTNFCSEQLVLLVLELVSAFIFAYGFRAFIAPSRVPWNVIDTQNLLPGFKQAQYEALDLATAASLVNPSHLVSGGASGIGQVLTRIVLLCGVTNIPSQTLQSLFYFVVNLPIIILGFLKVGKKFTFYSLVNVILTSILIDAIPQSWCELINIYDDNLARALAGGLTTGVSSGLALRIGTSTGGVDIISLYVAEKKGTTVGKYSLIMNTCTVITYTVLCFFHAPADGGVDAFENGATQLTMSLYTIIYFFTQTIIVDSLNTKNKKTELQVFTTSKVMNRVLVHGFPHACTIQEGRGGYSGAPLNVIYIVVSHSEVKKAIRIMHQVDPSCFISVLSTKQVYGKFYTKPID